MASAIQPNTPMNNTPAFSDLLRSWRKTHKLSQGALSSDTGISQRHLSFMESGRSAPSRDMVLRLASAFDLPLREKNALLNAAGFANAFSQKSLDDVDLVQARRALEIILKHHEPYGAVVVDRNWNLLMMNDATATLFGQFVDPIGVWAEIGGEKANVMRLTLHENGLRRFVDNFDETAGYFISQLSSELSSNPFNREARELLDEVKSYRDMPASSATQDKSLHPWLPFKLSNESISLEFFSMISTFGTPQDVTLQEIRIETFFPANDSTERYMRSLPER